jgi:ribonuclease VapC
LEGAVLDSFAILAFLFEEAGAHKVRELFEEAIEDNITVLVAAPNWGEVRYIVERRTNKNTWEEVRNRLLGLPLEVVPVDRDFAERAGAIKAVHAMSYADCFAAALGKERNLPVYTGDPEFKAVEKEIEVEWL